MTTDFTPRTDWHESIAPDEAERFAGYARAFADIQARRSRRFGDGRALHRKQLTAARGTLEVLAGLPVFARQGLFAQVGSYPVTLRLSNGGFDRARDRVPDIRGFALRVTGVSGPSALGGPAQAQCFTFINQEAFAFPRSDEFVAFALAAAQGGGALMRHLVRRYGVWGAGARMVQMLRTVGRPFGGFATETLHTAVPMANGAYAVRARLTPEPGNGAATPGANADWGADFSARLSRQPLAWALQLQPWVDETTTPLEDASVNWPTPYTTVARLHLPQQDAASPEGQALLAEAEAGVFDPWQALAAHRPLGDVQRARKVVYFESQKGRGAA